MLSLYAEAIGQIESSGNYRARGPRTKRGDRAYGKYQVMGANIPKWTKEVLGRRMKPSEFLADPQAQDAVFQAKFGEYVQRTGSPDDAASMWFTGKPLSKGGTRKDITGTTGNEYVMRFRQAVQSAAPQMASVDPGAVPAAPNDARGSVRPPERPGGYPADSLDDMLAPPDARTRAQQLAAQTVGAKYNPSGDTLTPADRNETAMVGTGLIRDMLGRVTAPEPQPPIRAPLPPGYHPPSQPARPITPTPRLAPPPAQDPTAMRLDNTAMVGTDLLRDLLSPRKPAPVPAEGPLGGPVNRPGDRPLPPPSSPRPDPQPTREPPLAGLPRHMGVPTASMVEQARASVDTGSSPPGVPTPRSPIGGPQIAAQRPDRATAIDPQYGRGNIADNPAFPPQPRQNPNRAMAGIPDSNPSFRHPLPTYGVLPGANPIPAPPPSYGNAIASLAPSPGSAPSPAPGGGGLSSLASLFSGFGGGGQQQEAPPLMQAPLTPLAMLLPVPDPFRGYS